MKKTLLISGMLSLLAFITGYILPLRHSPFADFITFLAYIVLSLVFLPLFFIIRAGKISASRNKRIVFRWMRGITAACLLVFLYKVFIPRNYGTPPLEKREYMHYWNLPTGSRIAYAFLPGHGLKKACPIIYLEGGPGGFINEHSIAMLQPLTEEGYDVYLYDQVGGGLSDRLKNIRDYTADRHKKDLEAIVTRIGAGKVILIGQSWGAILATLFTADNPGKIEKLIFTGPGPIYPIHSKLYDLPAPDSLHLREPYYTNRQGNEKAGNLRTKVMSFCATQWGIKLASDKEADDFAAYLNYEVNKSTVFDTSKISNMHQIPGFGYYCQIMTMASLGHIKDPRPGIKGSPIPILVMKGQADNQRWGYTHEYLDLFPDHRLAIIPAAGHGIYAEQPELYIKTIKDFLNN